MSPALAQYSALQGVKCSSTVYQILESVGTVQSGLENHHIFMKFGSKIVRRLENCTWWRHQMETFSILLVLCVGNSLGEFTSQRPVTRIFDVFFDLRLNKRLSKQPRRCWLETPSRSLWRHWNYEHESVTFGVSWDQHIARLIHPKLWSQMRQNGPGALVTQLRSIYQKD